VIERVATGVRYVKRRGVYDVHELLDAVGDSVIGRTYRARCGRVLLGQLGAVLTTKEVTCSQCLR
jgi:hypothetical protein